MNLCGIGDRMFHENNSMPPNSIFCSTFCTWHTNPGGWIDQKLVNGFPGSIQIRDTRPGTWSRQCRACPGQWLTVWFSNGGWLSTYSPAAGGTEGSLQRRATNTVSASLQSHHLHRQKSYWAWYQNSFYHHYQGVKNSDRPSLTVLLWIAGYSKNCKLGRYFYGFKKGFTIRLSIRTCILKTGINQGMSESNIIRDPEKCGGEPGFG